MTGDKPRKVTTMQRIFVLSKNKTPLMPCHPARVRKLLKLGKAAVFRLHPFTIILRERVKGELQKMQLKFDPGSKVTGIALVLFGEKKKQLVWAANLEHRGDIIRKNLLSRRGVRRARRFRNTRYRKPRFLNRTRKKGWLAPSLQSRADNILSWAARLNRFVPLSTLAVETVRFDMHKLQNPEISGVSYQQGTLFGCEVREYLLEKWSRCCAYCDKKDVPLEIDHIVPKSKGGSDRVSNLALSCHKCNQKKGNQSLIDFLKNEKKTAKILAASKASLKDAAAINSIRYEIGNKLKSFSLPIEFSTGGRTKYNRAQSNYPKDHWIDAACVGEEGEDVSISPYMQPLLIKATGRGSRQMCLPDKYGFPRTKPKSQKIVRGFKTGDFVKAVVPKGKNQGVYFGTVAVRTTGSFCLKTPSKKVDGISAKHCVLAQKSLGYTFSFKKNKPALPPPAKARGIRALEVL